MFSLPLSRRVQLLGLAALVIVGAVTATLYSASMSTTLRMREAHLRDVVDIMVAGLGDLQAQVDAGALALPDAQKVARQRLETARFGKDDYFFAFDGNLKIAAHGGNPDLDGSNQSDFKDADGIPVFAKMLDLSKAGGGAIYYSFNRFTEGGEAAMVPKLGYVRGFDPWGWTIGTGTYLDDIRADMAATRNAALITGFLGAVLLAAAVAVIGGGLVPPVRRLAARMATLGAGDLDSAVPLTGRRDEFGEMAQSLQSLRDTLIAAASAPAAAASDAAEAERNAALAEAARLADALRGREADLAAAREMAEQQAAAAADAARREAEAARRAADAEHERSLGTIAEALRTLASGDLSVRMDDVLDGAHDDLRRDFNAAAEEIEDVIARIVESSGLIAEQGRAISTSAEDVAKRTEQTAATLEQTAAALEQLTSSVSLAAKGASDADKLVVNARGTAEQSGEVVRQAVDAMGAIEQSSQKISKIIHVIDDIAFQTNLLALNAGVEAARAGEAGRGFAVVASEVRALAQRSSDAAREINALISESGDQVNRGVALVGEAGETLRGIAAAVSEISAHVSDIARSAGEQSVGLGEINTSVSHLDHTTQSNAALFQETLVASQSLTREAVALGDVVTRFKLAPGRVAEVHRLEPPPAPAGQAQARPRAAAPKAANPGSPPPRMAATGTGPAVIEDAGWEDF